MSLHGKVGKHQLIVLTRDIIKTDLKQKLKKLYTLLPFPPQHLKSLLSYNIHPHLTILTGKELYTNDNLYTNNNSNRKLIIG